MDSQQQMQLHQVILIWWNQLLPYAHPHNIDILKLTGDYYDIDVVCSNLLYSYVCSKLFYLMLASNDKGAYCLYHNTIISAHQVILIRRADYNIMHIWDMGHIWK